MNEPMVLPPQEPPSGAAGESSPRTEGINTKDLALGTGGGHNFESSSPPLEQPVGLIAKKLSIKIHRKVAAQPTPQMNTIPLTAMDAGIDTLSGTLQETGIVSDFGQTADKAKCPPLQPRPKEDSKTPHLGFKPPLQHPCQQVATHDESQGVLPIPMPYA